MDLVDQIGGWKSVNSIGNGYGKGYRLAQIRTVIERIKVGHRVLISCQPMGVNMAPAYLTVKAQIYTTGTGGVASMLGS